MSLQRRITAVVAVAVAAISILIGAFGYLSTRSQLVAGIRSELLTRIGAVDTHHSPDGHDSLGSTAGSGGAPAGDGGAGFHTPPNPAFGGAPGFFQLVAPSGSVVNFAGTATAAQRLPITAAVRRVAAGTAARFFFSATVAGHHLEILTAPARDRRGALEIALPLTVVDRDLSSLLVTDALIVGGGVLVSILIGLLVARAAIAPIGRFISETAQVTRALAKPRRLEETGAEELRHLAVYFNQTLEALERSVSAQRHLIADASHELRTPLAALRSNIQIFLEAERLPLEDRVELQAAIVAEVDDLTQLVSDVLELARGAAPSDAVEQVELDGLLRDAIARTQRRAPGLSFVLDIAPTVIMNNPDRVGRAVQNVIDNARRWSAADGVVEVTLRDGTLTVRDHGPGFRDGDLPFVFDRFFRADESRRLPGSGLGLAIVKQAAEAHGGSARAANAADGGAVVSVSFGGAVTQLLSASHGAVTDAA